VLLTKTGPRCISFRCKITVSLAQGAVHDAEAYVADPVFVRSTITSQPTIAPREAIKAHSHVAQGSEHRFRDRPALIASGGQLLVTIVDEVAFNTGCGNSTGRCNSCLRGGPSSRIDCILSPPSRRKVTKEARWQNRRRWPPPPPTAWHGHPPPPPALPPTPPTPSNPYSWLQVVSCAPRLLHRTPCTPAPAKHPPPIPPARPQPCPGEPPSDQ